MNFIAFLLIGLAAGFLAGKIFKGKSFGILGNIIVGIIGSMVGGFVFGLIGLGANGLIGSLVTATTGAIILLWLVKKIMH